MLSTVQQSGHVVTLEQSDFDDQFPVSKQTKEDGRFFQRKDTNFRNQYMLEPDQAEHSVNKSPRVTDSKNLDKHQDQDGDLNYGYDVDPNGSENLYHNMNEYENDPFGKIIRSDRISTNTRDKNNSIVTRLCMKKDYLASQHKYILYNALRYVLLSIIIILMCTDKQETTIKFWKGETPNDDNDNDNDSYNDSSIVLDIYNDSNVSNSTANEMELISHCCNCYNWSQMENDEDIIFDYSFCARKIKTKYCVDNSKININRHDSEYNQVKGYPGNLMIKHSFLWPIDVSVDWMYDTTYWIYFTLFPTVIYIICSIFVSFITKKLMYERILFYNFVVSTIHLTVFVAIYTWYFGDPKDSHDHDDNNSSYNSGNYSSIGNSSNSSNSSSSNSGSSSDSSNRCVISQLEGDDFLIFLLLDWFAFAIIVMPLLLYVIRFIVALSCLRSRYKPCFRKWNYTFEMGTLILFVLVCCILYMVCCMLYVLLG